MVKAGMLTKLRYPESAFFLPRYPSSGSSLVNAGLGWACWACFSASTRPDPDGYMLFANDLGREWYKLLVMVSGFPHSCWIVPEPDGDRLATRHARHIWLIHCLHKDTSWQQPTVASIKGDKGISGTVTFTQESESSPTTSKSHI